MKKQKKEDIGELYHSGLYDEIERNGFGELLLPLEYAAFQPGLVCKVISIINNDDNFENMEEREVRCRIEKIGRARKKNTRDGHIMVQKLRFIKQD